MPLIKVWPVSESWRTVKVGSSSTILAITSASFSSSLLVLGSTAMEMTGVMKVISPKSTGWARVQKLSPVVAFFRPTTPTMSPAYARWIRSFLSA